jgi:hypothetical protein
MMNNPEADNTIKEILEEDKAEIKKRKRGGCFLRLLIIVTLLFICIYGFILFRQKLLDLEAQAIISARQTATANVFVSESKSFNPDLQTAAIVSPDITPTVLLETATPDPMLERTAIVSAQLTSVAEFQSSVTPEP